MKKEMNEKERLEKRLEWLKNNKPETYKEKNGLTWEEYVEANIIRDMYSFSFNHPYYGGNSGLTDDEVRNSLLDDLGIPKFND